jgi:hypothetical protein
MDTTIALSRGGKDGLAASSGSIFEGKIAFVPALSPEANGVRVKAEPSRRGHVGKRGVLVQQQDEMGALAEMGRRRASAHQAAGLSDEVFGEGWAMAWKRARHGAAPGAICPLLLSDDALTLLFPRSWATLQLFAEWTTKE